ncbi:hypothetical protein BK809_0006060 [Diplodia seriata]|uniref:T6SS Phospholipase effector Tle1-like catalytic domain-containing protein n=1 Tax=Diplodia seriata TaxID=420778 RepID=A0A1S8BPG2_9PEZI|nr:hypothetical protein BK809_0006060 [Diplodia seriata]
MAPKTTRSSATNKDRDKPRKRGKTHNHPEQQEDGFVNGAGEYEGRLKKSVDLLRTSDPEWSKSRPHDMSSYMRELATRCEKNRLFICCDGTWKNASGTIAPLTNVAKIARCVDRIGRDSLELPDDENDFADGFSDQDNSRKWFGLVRQLVYYSSGVGTQSSLSMDSGLAGATGQGVIANILGAYCFICNNYNFGSTRDEIILVGFSRGAFTIRCLADFISKVGLLRRKGLPFLRMLFDHWRRNETSELDKKATALDALRYTGVRIKVLAEFDTVSAMGLPLGFWKRELSFVEDEVPRAVDNAFFAFALDEKRPSFSPMLWRSKAHSKTIVKQCGFVGCHSDIGGGNPDAGLSTVSLMWMIARIKDTCLAEFDETALFQFITPLQSSFLRDENDVGRRVWPGTRRELFVENLSSTEGMLT